MSAIPPGLFSDPEALGLEVEGLLAEHAQGRPEHAQGSELHPRAATYTVISAPVPLFRLAHRPLAESHLSFVSRGPREAALLARKWNLEGQTRYRKWEDGSGDPRSGLSGSELR